jgi:hypothetical protein
VKLHRGPDDRVVPCEGEGCHFCAKRETINHPDHYNQHPAGIECIEVVEHMNFNVGNAIKYLWRAGLKGHGDADDLRKAIWYINREIERSKSG